MRFASLPLTLGFLLLPFAASASETTTWDFKGKVPAGWADQGLSAAETTALGVAITAGSNGGGIVSQQPAGVGGDTAIIRMRSTQPVQGYFMWHAMGNPQQVAPQVPFKLEGKGTSERIAIALSVYPEWTGRADAIGLVFQPNANVIIEDVTIERFSLIEKAEELIYGFWMFDEFRPYSINFLWGPLLSTDPVTRATLYDTLPPRAYSATRVMYIILGAAFAIFLITFFARKPAANKLLGIFCAVFIACWILFDIRMGTELSVYALRDINSYTLKPEGAKMLRTHLSIYDVLNRVLPTLQQHERFGLVSDSAFHSLVRYRAYPSLPQTPERDQSGITLWLVAYAPTAKIDEQQRLTVDGKVLSGSGKIIEQLDANSFLFSTQP